MGYDTHFHGTLQFTRDLSASELRWVNQILNAHLIDTDDISDAVWQAAKDEQAARGKGPLVVHGPDASQQAASMKGFIIGEGLSADYAGSLRISDDFDGLIYASEKTYDMVAGVNFIIVNAHTRIPDFGLKGELLADTEFEPHQWLLKIGDDGLAYQQKISAAEFLEARRKLYPDGYNGLGLCEVSPQGTQPADDDPSIPTGGITVFTQKVRERMTTIINANDGGMEFEFRIDPRHAFEVAGKLIVSAVTVKAHDAVKRIRGDPTNG